MTPQTRRAAVRMAAKAAMLATLGCSSGPHAAPTPSNTAAGGSAAAVACGDYLNTLTILGPDQQLAPDDPLAGRHDVYGAFTEVAARQRPRTRQCCTEELGAAGERAPHRFACCSALGGLPASVNDKAACTPWGPPCPPEMPAAAA